MPSQELPDVLRSVLAQAEGGDSPQRWDDLIEQVEGAVAVRYALQGHGELVRIGRFEGIGFRGRGGFGVVFEVRDPVLSRHVALKLCLTSGPRAAEALMDEARLLATFSHPNIVRVYEPGRFGENVFFVMELIDGPDGHQFARRQPPPSWQEAVDVYRAVGRGLAAAHDAGIVHGDFKPANILLDGSDWPRVSDFGLARVVREHWPAADSQSPGGHGGTLAYMAPEVLRREPGDALSDQWSFCMSLWETLEGSLPFGGSSEQELLAAVEAFGQEPGIGACKIPENVREVVRVGLSLHPEERHADMHALVAELDRLLEAPAERGGASDPAPAGPDRELEPATSKGSAGASEDRIPVFISGLLVGAIALGVLSYSHVPWPWSETPTQPPPKGPEPVDEMDEMDEMDEPPCLDEGAPFETDAALRGICFTLRRGEYEDAATLWQEVYDAREQKAKTCSDWLELATSNAIVARTFLDQAKTTGDSEAKPWAVAFTELADADRTEASKVETTDECHSVVSQLQVFLAKTKDVDTTGT